MIRNEGIKVELCFIFDMEEVSSSTEASFETKWLNGTANVYDDIMYVLKLMLGYAQAKAMNK